MERAKARMEEVKLVNKLMKMEKLDSPAHEG